MSDRTSGKEAYQGPALFKAALQRAAWVLLLSIALTPAVVADPPGVRSLPNDPMLGEQWYLFSPSDERGNPGSINAIEAWRRVRPAEPIVVALLDTGVNYTHPDLA